MALNIAGAIQRLWDRILSGAPNADPLYLSNRTWKQKLRFWAIAASPVLTIVGVVIYGLWSPAPTADKPLSDLPPAEIAARTRIIPNDFTVPQNTDLQIVEVSIDRAEGQHYVKGVLRNNTARRFDSAELTFDLTDEQGSQVGGVSTRVRDVGPMATSPFRFSIPQRNATAVFVREIHTIR